MTATAIHPVPSPWSGHIVAALAYLTGFWQAKDGDPEVNPWQAGSCRAQAWQAGYRDGSKARAA